MLILKATSEASYKNIVNILDEVAICRVKKYAVAAMGAAEKDWLKDNR